MKHEFETKVYYADTDAYGVVWHGTYLRWMERGRVDFCAKLGLDLVEMKKCDVLMPVTNMNVRYKSSAKLDEEITIETTCEIVNSFLIRFKQKIKSKETQKIHIDATFDVVAVNSEGKMYRKIPEQFMQKLERGLETCPQPV